jgi:purine-binding chemotaxis protein CheW
VQKILPIAELVRPPGLPRALEGVLNLAGVPVPVLRLDRLFHLPEQAVTLSSMLIQFHADGSAGGGLAVLVDRVERIMPVPESSLLPVDEKQSFNGCAQASVRVAGSLIHILSPARILTERERSLLDDFEQDAVRRLQDWQSRDPESRAV